MRSSREACTARATHHISSREFHVQEKGCLGKSRVTLAYGLQGVNAAIRNRSPQTPSRRFLPKGRRSKINFTKNFSCVFHICLLHKLSGKVESSYSICLQASYAPPDCPPHALLGRALDSSKRVALVHRKDKGSWCAGQEVLSPRDLPPSSRVIARRHYCQPCCFTGCVPEVWFPAERTREEGGSRPVVVNHAACLWCVLKETTRGEMTWPLQRKRPPRRSPRQRRRLPRRSRLQRRESNHRMPGWRAGFLSGLGVTLEHERIGIACGSAAHAAPVLKWQRPDSLRRCSVRWCGGKARR